MLEGLLCNWLFNVCLLLDSYRQLCVIKLATEQSSQRINFELLNRTLVAVLVLSSVEFPPFNREYIYSGNMWHVRFSVRRCLEAEQLICEERYPEESEQLRTLPSTRCIHK